MNDNTFTWLIVGVGAVLLVGGVLWLGGRNDSSGVEAVAGAKVGVVEQSYDWGNIPINDGDVAKEFVVTNEGSEVLSLSNVKTSCMCTKAQLVKGTEKSPEFGMHQKSTYVMKVQPGEQVNVKVVYDPAFHGPSSLGPITRQVVMDTSDPDRSRLQFDLRATVVK